MGSSLSHKRSAFLAVTTACACFAAPALLALACSSGTSESAADSGNESSMQQQVDGTGGGDGNETIELTSLDDVCDQGPTGRQLLAFVSPFYAGTYTPPADRSAPAPPWTGPTSPSALTMAVTYEGGKILCTPRHMFNCPPGAPCAAPTGPSVSVELQVVFKTSNRLLEETLVAVATLHTGDSRINWDSDLPGTKLAGKYPLAAGTPAEVRLAWSGTFAGATMTPGSISELTTKISFAAGAWTASGSDAGPDASGD